MVGGAHFISVADVQSASTGKHPFTRAMPTLQRMSPTTVYTVITVCMPFGVCNASWLFTEMAHKTLGHLSDLLFMWMICVYYPQRGKTIKNLWRAFS